MKNILLVLAVISLLVVMMSPIEHNAIPVYAATLTPFEPTATPTRTHTPTPTYQIYPLYTPTRTPVPTKTPNRDCGIHIYCTPTPQSSNS